MSDVAGALGSLLGQNYLAPAFYFRVSFENKSGVFGSLFPSDTSFLEVSGINTEMQVDSYTEGGENRFVYQLPKGAKASKLVLKRGIASMKSPLVKWCISVLEGGFVERIQPQQLNVSLLDAHGLPLRSWSFVNAYPVNWQVEDFKSDKNELAIEKIELNYNYVNRTA